ncbi:hypothetical protein [Caldimonas tepidiphila]|uniref:hypothetical protein n=1 Tax=Caldimonas tepidiphila TaxID=2315841 RepID=UPI000E5AEAA7|nr:hypothetical protein [Caldimonas tepidiphila]
MSPLRQLLGIGRRGGVQVSPSGGAAPAGVVQVSGMRLESVEDGRLRLTLEQLTLRNLRLHAGVAEVGVAQLVLHEAVVTLAMAEAGAGFELLGLVAREIRLQGLQAALSSAAGCRVPAAGDWRLDALGGMEGRLHAFITDAAWIIDAGVNVPVQQGQVDFNRVTVEHVGPDSSMGVSPAGLYVDARHGGRSFLFLFTDGKVPGASFEKRAGGRPRGAVTDRGRIDLRAFAEGLLARGGVKSIGRSADRHVESTVDRTRLDGELRLGDGMLGAGPHHLRLEGQAQGRNRVRLSAAVLGHKLMLHMPELAAADAAFELLGMAARTGAISACVEVEATELRADPGAGCGPALRIDVDELTVRDVVLGEPPQAASGG